jgi:DHA2 family multidrug resistance protein-like MFS transporter
MASSLGSAFGVAISATVYGAIAANGNLESAASAGIVVNVIFGILSILSIIILVPKNAGKASAAPEKSPKSAVAK